MTEGNDGACWKLCIRKRRFALLVRSMTEALVDVVLPIPLFDGLTSLVAGKSSLKPACRPRAWRPWHLTPSRREAAWVPAAVRGPPGAPVLTRCVRRVNLRPRRALRGRGTMATPSLNPRQVGPPKGVRPSCLLRRSRNLGSAPCARFGRAAHLQADVFQRSFFFLFFLRLLLMVRLIVLISGVPAGRGAT